MQNILFVDLNMGKLIEEKQYECICHTFCNEKNKFIVTRDNSGLTEIEFIYHIGCIDEKITNFGLFTYNDIDALIFLLK